MFFYKMKTERKIILYIATSSDGFIARENDSVDWLAKYNDTGYDYGYDEFIITIMPEEIGSGIPLFKDSNFTSKLNNFETKIFGDVIQLIYSK